MAPNRHQPTTLDANRYLKKVEIFISFNPLKQYHHSSQTLRSAIKA
jgi:hypothetical protein